MQTINTDEFLFVLAHCPFLSHRERWKILIDTLPEFQTYTHVRERDYSLSYTKRLKFRQFEREFDFFEMNSRYKTAKVRHLSLQSNDYPYALKNCYEPPIVLFYQGDLTLLHEPLIGMVGARECTDYGEKVLDVFIPSIVSQGLVTVSGLAKGIDTHVHTKTMESGGQTIAVIGNGIGYTYPKENKALQEEISKRHLLISEFPLNMPPRKHHFPLRNRIIAGLSRGVVVVEARERSGSLITARLALEEGRDVFAVPGSIFNDESKGCLDLIKLGAVVCQSPEDIFEEWNMEIVK